VQTLASDIEARALRTGAVDSHVFDALIPLLFDSPLGVIATHLKASKIRFIQFNQIVQSPGGE
ncbi:MAG: hypothetical protein ORN25_11250, partial [Caulobacteraceae bacterium]|nr:hypothetical protein [Caulobacteraceae bacterium]